MPWSTNAAQARSSSGCDKGRPSTNEGGIKRQTDAAIGQRRQLSFEPSQIPKAQVGHRVEPPPTFGGYLHDPTVPRGHVGQGGTQIMLQRSLPTDPVVRKHDRGVETSSIELKEASLRVGIARRELLKVEICGQAVQQALPKYSDAVDVTRAMRASQAQATIAKHQPGVAEVVLCHMQRNIAIRRVDVLPPHSRRLKEVGIGVDEQVHCASYPNAPDEPERSMQPYRRIADRARRGPAQHGQPASPIGSREPKGKRPARSANILQSRTGSFGGRRGQRRGRHRGPWSECGRGV